jgi:hypothetical protein
MIKIICAVAVAVFVVGISIFCWGASQDNTWLAFRSPQDRDNWVPVPVQQVHQVKGEMLQKAMSLLSEQSSRELSAEEVSQLVTGNASEGQFKMYLLRAEENSNARGQYLVYTKGTAVVVRHESLARHSSFQKSVIAVELLNKPSKIYVEVDVAE